MREGLVSALGLYPTESWCEVYPQLGVFTPAAIEQIESLQAEQKEKADADTDHKSSITAALGPRGMHARMTTLFPDDAKQHADDLAEIATNPANWQ